MLPEPSATIGLKRETDRSSLIPTGTGYHYG